MSQIFKINTDKIAQQTIDDEVIIVNLDEGYYYSLLNTGAEIWSKIEKGLSRNQIIAEILQTYEGSCETIAAGVDSLIKDLEQENIIFSLSELSENNQSFSDLTLARNQEQRKSQFVPPTLQKYTDMQDLLTLDPIHDVDETGWPNAKQG